MFIGTKENQKKIEEIRTAPEVLRIEARSAGGEAALKLFLLLLAALLFVYRESFLGMFREKTTQQQIVLGGMILFFLAAVLLTLYVMKRRKGTTLVVTEKGLFVEPSLAQFWRDIEEYQWRDSPNVNNLLFSGMKQEATLFLVNNKGAWPKIYDLGRYGIFFTPQQMRQWDDLCKRLGIKKGQE